MTVGQLVVHFVRRGPDGRDTQVRAEIHPKSGVVVTDLESGKELGAAYPEEIDFLHGLLELARKHKHAFVRPASE